MTAHTKGPWSFHICGDAEPRLVTEPTGGGEPWAFASHYIGSGETIIAEVTWRDINSGGGWPNVTEWDEFKANARLIAAAPDLFEALEDALSDIEAGLPQPHDTAEYLREIIAKAKGGDA